MEQARLKKLVAGNEEAWSTFFNEFDPLIRSVVSWGKWRFSEDVRKELAQDIRAELNRSIPKFRGDSSLEYFIKRICIHRSVDRVRKQVREREHLVSLVVTDDSGASREMDVEAGEKFDPVTEVEGFERAQALKEQVELLDETCRTAIHHFYVESLSYKEISAQLGIAVNTVGSRLAKCLEKLRGLVEKNPFLQEYR